MKRGQFLFEELVSYDNIELAINEVAKTHRWYDKHKPNKKAADLDTNKDFYIYTIQDILYNGFKNSKMQSEERWDKNAKKIRTITFPPIFPDQVVHHAVIQVLIPYLMKHMDPWCLASIPGRGAIQGVKAIRKWIRKDKKGTMYYTELDIHHFYDYISKELVMDSFRKVIKDRKMMCVIEALVDDGLLKGMYSSQWFANFVLQPLDKMIREMGASHYIRFVDNLTIFSDNPFTLYQIINRVHNWLNIRGFTLNRNTKIQCILDRPVNALGYRINRKGCRIRKNRLLTIKRKIKQIDKAKRISKHTAESLTSMIGGVKHASNCLIYKNIIPKGLIRFLKHIERINTPSNLLKWEDYLIEYKNKYGFNPLN